MFCIQCEKPAVTTTDKNYKIADENKRKERNATLRRCSIQYPMPIHKRLQIYYVFASTHTKTYSLSLFSGMHHMNYVEA